VTSIEPSRRPASTAGCIQQPPHRTGDARADENCDINPRTAASNVRIIEITMAFLLVPHRHHGIAADCASISLADVSTFWLNSSRSGVGPGEAALTSATIAGGEQRHHPLVFHRSGAAEVVVDVSIRSSIRPV